MNIGTQNCQPDLLELFLSGDLDRTQELQLADHLESCDVCRRSLESSAAEPESWTEAGRLLKPTPFDWNPDAEPDNLLNPIPHQIRNVLDSLAPSDDPEMLGQLGGYEVSGVVGAGAMGVVLKASDKSLDRTVAIKVLSPHLATSGAARKRFAREAKAAAAVLHANVIAIHGVSNDQSMPHLVMPYVRGTSLQKRINDDGSLPVNEVLRISAQIAAGLAAAHAQGLVHRDIKPANILLEEGVERVAITDFGLARAVDDASLTRTGIIAGTPQYMSPEQSRGESVDQRSDLFSLGSVMYAMCVGRPPFRSETTYGVIQRINNDQPTPIREINPEVPAWLAQIIERLMSKEAGDRYESAQEVSDLLEQCLSHVQQPSTTPLPDSLAARTRPRGLFSGSGRKAWTMTVFAMLGLGLLGMFLWQETAPPDISGKWYGDGWGEVELKHQALGQYQGEYTDTFGDQPGTMEIEWSPEAGQFKGKWGEGKDRFGKISLSHSGDGISCAWTTSKNSGINPGLRELSASQWTRRPTANPSGISDSSEPVGPEKTDSRQQMLRGTGKVIALRSEESGQTVCAPTKGVVTKIADGLAEGTQVKKGETLFQIEPLAGEMDRQTEVHKAQLATLKAEEQAAKAEFEAYGQSVAGFTEAMGFAIAAAKAKVSSAKEKLHSKQSQVAAFRAKERQAKLNYQRQKSIRKKDLTTQNEVEQSKKEWDVAVADYESVQRDVNSLEHELNAKENEVKEKISVGQTKIDQAIAMHQIAQGRIASARKEISDLLMEQTKWERLLIIAPHDGSVLRLNVNASGGVVKEGDPLLTLGPEATRKAVELLIDGNEILLVRKGQKVRLEFEGWPSVSGDGYFGTVASVDVMASDFDKFRILVTPNENDGAEKWPADQSLRPGVRANGWVLGPFDKRSKLEIQKRAPEEPASQSPPSRLTN